MYIYIYIYPQITREYNKYCPVTVWDNEKTLASFRKPYLDGITAWQLEKKKTFSIDMPDLLNNIWKNNSLMTCTTYVRTICRCYLKVWYKGKITDPENARAKFCYD